MVGDVWIATDEYVRVGRDRPVRRAEVHNDPGMADVGDDVDGDDVVTKVDEGRGACSEAAGSSQAQQGPVQLEGPTGLTVLTVDGEFAVLGRLGQPGVSAAGVEAEPEGRLVRFLGHRNPAAIAAYHFAVGAAERRSCRASAGRSITSGNPSSSP